MLTTIVRQQRLAAFALNDDRNPVLQSLKISDTLSESRRSEETRTDMLVLSGGGKSLPVEIKRHFNPELWTAPTSQLEGYAQA